MLIETTIGSRPLICAPRVAAVVALLGLGFTGTPAQAQTATGVPSTQTPARKSFDVVSIRQSKPGTPGHFTPENGRWHADGPLWTYIISAWNLMPAREQIDAMIAHLPKWVSTDTFEIDARAEGDPTQDQMRPMLQSLLADRFSLKIHFETAQTPVLALVPDKPGKTGPKLRPHSEGPPCDVHLPSQTQDPGSKSIDVFPPVCGQLTATPMPNHAVLTGGRDMTVGQIATFVSSLGRLDRPVVDQTGFSGQFDFTLEFTPTPKGPSQPEQAAQPDSQGTTLQEALQEQLGLKLKPATVPLDTLVIDHVERPSEN